MSILRVAVPVALAAVLLLSGCTSAPTEREPVVSGGSVSQPAEVNDVDLHFLAMMTPHHDQAVQMSDIVLAAEGISVETLEIAERIKTGQQAEIDIMLGWVDAWGQRGLLAQHSEHIANGMIMPEQMNELATLSGAEAERVFLEQMTLHHEGAIAMTLDQIDNGGYAELRALAQQMIEVQSAEIVEMREMLGA